MGWFFALKINFCENVLKEYKKVLTISKIMLYLESNVLLEIVFGGFSQ